MRDHTGGQAGTTGGTWLGGGVGRGRVWAGEGRAGWQVFFGWGAAPARVGTTRLGWQGGEGSGGTLVRLGYGPILCRRFGVKNARVVKKVG